MNMIKYHTTSLRGVLNLIGEAIQKEWQTLRFNSGLLRSARNDGATQTITKIPYLISQNPISN